MPITLQQVLGETGPAFVAIFTHGPGGSRGNTL